MAKAFRSEVTVLHAASHGFPPYCVDSSPSFREESEAHQEHLGDRLEELAAQTLGAGITWETRLSNDKPIDAILKCFESYSADFLILGSHGHSGAAGLLWGSIPENVLQIVGYPILVVTKYSGSDALRLKSSLHSRFLLVKSALYNSILFPDSDTGAQMLILHATDDRSGQDEFLSKVEAWLPKGAKESCRRFFFQTMRYNGTDFLRWARDHDIDLLTNGVKHRPFPECTNLDKTIERIVRHSPCSVMIVPCRGNDVKSLEASRGLV